MNLLLNVNSVKLQSSRFVHPWEICRKINEIRKGLFRSVLQHTLACTSVTGDARSSYNNGTTETDSCYRKFI